MNSRIITYPDIVAREQNHTVVLIDINWEDITRCGTFCARSEKNYDLYIYNEDCDDLQWLSEITKRADRILIQEQSKVYVLNDSKVLKVGVHCETPDVLDYLTIFDTIKETT